MRRVRGFSLIETLIVIVIIAGAAMVTMNLINSEQRRQQRTAMVAAQASEMAAMTRALEAYLESSDSLPTELDTPFVLDPAILVTEGLLPADFAIRPASGRTTATSPLGQEYLMIGVNTADGYRGALVPTGDPAAGFLARAGVPGNPESMTEYGISVMHSLKQDHLVPAGITAAGSMLVDRDVSGFSLDLTMLLETPLPHPAVISLAGFPEFSQSPPIVIGDPVGPPPPDCYDVATIDEPLSCNAGFNLTYEYELCADFTLPASSEESTGAGLISITRSPTLIPHVPAEFMGSTLSGSFTGISWTGAADVPETAADCPGLALKADSFQVFNPGNGVTYEYQNLWCAADGQYHDASTLARTTENRGSASDTVAPADLGIYAPPRQYGFHSTTVAYAGTGQTTPPADHAFGHTSFMEEGSEGHRISFVSPVTSRYRTSVSPAFMPVTGQEGNVFSAPTGTWTPVTQLDACVAGSTTEAPVYLLSSPMGAPNMGSRYYAWSITDSGAPIRAAISYESVSIDGTEVINNHYCGNRQVSTSAAGCPTISGTGTSRVTTQIIGGVGTRRVGVCCR